MGVGGVMHNYDLSGARVGGPLAALAAELHVGLLCEDWR